MIWASIVGLSVYRALEYCIMVCLERFCKVEGPRMGPASPIRDGEVVALKPMIQ